MRFLRLLAFAPVLAVAPALAADDPAPRPDLVGTRFGEDRAWFKDWLAACRPDGYCSANAYFGRRENLPAYHLRVGRAPGADFWDLIFTPVFELAREGSPMEMRVNGQPGAWLGPGDGWQRLEGGAVNEYQIAPSLFQMELLPRMLKGRTLTVAFTDEQGVARRAEFSLNGLTAAMKWIQAR